ncbi:FecR family protein [Luteolibacter flavescens]|uniref:FecR family protein n=1 Tax=Luteolibacter flavescens TaxID=1859460 RepID=A0ABT3FJ93_9BACT|nr:FecR family protein [Luteolibacter flavescens]MCW1883628.1 FecR family protein [Luteolibacter flavescens]
MDPDWQHWIDRLKSQDLTEAELREFEEALRADPSRQDAYLSELLAEVALEAEDLPDPLAAPGQKIIAMPTVVRRWPHALGIAAGIAALATLSYFAGGHLSGNGSREVAATVTDTDSLAEMVGLRIGQPLPRGSVAVPDGSEIGIAMRGGARLQIRGPANLHIDGPDKIRLEKGRVSTYAPPYASGFTVDTVDGRVIDFGTRFVTATGTQTGGTEVHVIEGLVTANASPETTPAQNLESEKAAILKGGVLVPTEYLAQRLAVPLDPVSPDRDGDGFPDSIENFYGTLAADPTSFPAALRISEAFAGYTPGAVRGAAMLGIGARPGALWEGAGTFDATGLSFTRDGRDLAATGGSITTTGEKFEGAILRFAPEELARDGVTYISFLMRNSGSAPDCFSGLLLYQEDREELFVGKLSIANTYGSRLKQSLTQNSYAIPMDGETHLFVIRIDRTRLVTDIFVDPLPGEPESGAVRDFRYQDVPDFDRIVVRSGSKEGKFPATFDEVRVGLTWGSVVPARE